MKPVQTSFTKTELTVEEQKAGSILSSLHHAVIQNMIADIAEEKLALKFTPNDVLTFTQQEAELAGQIGILKHLLDLSLESQAHHLTPSKSL
jgi:hypothetical protein